MMEDATKPCVRCGAMDRYEKDSKCKFCVRARVKARKAKNLGLTNPSLMLKPCCKCGGLKRNKHGNCMLCDSAKKREYRLANPGKFTLMEANRYRRKKKERDAYIIDWRRKNYLKVNIYSLRKGRKKQLAKRLAGLSVLQHKITTEAPK